MMLNPIYENIPHEIMMLPQWVNWRSILRKEGGKLTKPPYQPDGNLAKTDNPQTWSAFDNVKEASILFDGIGFVLTQEDPYVGLDFDHCRCPAFDGATPWANSPDVVLPEIANHIRSMNSYTEVSPSRRGIRVFLKGKLPVDGKRKGPIEAYRSGRYVTVTGHAIEGFPRTIEHRQMEIDSFYKQVFGTSETHHAQERTVWTDTPTCDWKSSIEKAFESKNGADIRRLWNGDYSRYPSQSEADLSLCSHLAFWLGGDAAVMNAAFRQSGLYRPKWDAKHGEHTYGKIMIQKALDGCTAFYGNRQAQGGRG